LSFRNLQLRTRRIAAVVEPAIDRFVLTSAVDADEAPREVIVDRRRGEGRNDEREKTERSILRAIQRVLADAAAHLARIVWSRAALGQPAIGREQPRKRRPQRLDARPIVVNRRPQPLGSRYTASFSPFKWRTFPEPRRTARSDRPSAPANRSRTR